MTELERALDFNQEIQNALRTVFLALNQGQQQKLLKNAEVQTILFRYGIGDICDG